MSFAITNCVSFPATAKSRLRMCLRLINAMSRKSEWNIDYEIVTRDVFFLITETNSSDEVIEAIIEVLVINKLDVLRFRFESFASSLS